MNPQYLALSKFGEEFLRLKFTQPIASQIDDVPLSAINSWRSRGFVSFGKNKVPRDVQVSGFHLLQLIFFRELAWVIGPAKTATIANALINTTMDFGNDLKEAGQNPTELDRVLEKYSDLVLTIDRPNGPYDSAKPMQVSPGESVSAVQDIGLPWMCTHQAEFGITGTSAAILIVPLGSIWTLTAFRAGRFLIDE